MATVLGMSDPARLDRDELEVELATLAAHLSAGRCRWLELVGELDRRGGWAEDGPGSCAAWGRLALWADGAGGARARASRPATAGAAADAGGVRAGGVVVCGGAGAD